MSALATGSALTKGPTEMHGCVLCGRAGCTRYD